MNLYPLFLLLALLPLVAPSVSVTASTSGSTSAPAAGKGSTPPAGKGSTPPAGKDTTPPAKKDTTPPAKKDTTPPAGKETASASSSIGSLASRVLNVLYMRNEIPEKDHKEPKDEKGKSVLTDLKTDHFKRYNGLSRARDLFIKDVISKIPALFPKSVTVSGLEYINQDNKPMCQTDFTFKSKLGRVITAEPKMLSHESQSVKVHFKLNIQNPIIFKIFPQSAKAEADKISVNATYNFKGDHSAIINLKLPTSFVLMELEKHECVVEISSIRLSNLNDPQKSSKPKKPGFTYQMEGHWMAVGTQSNLLVKTISFAIIDDLRKKLKAKDHWICFDEKLDKEDDEEKKRIENFKTNCKEGK